MIYTVLPSDSIILKENVGMFLLSKLKFHPDGRIVVITAMEYLLAKIGSKAYTTREYKIPPGTIFFKSMNLIVSFSNSFRDGTVGLDMPNYEDAFLNVPIELRQIFRLKKI